MSEGGGPRWAPATEEGPGKRFSGSVIIIADVFAVIERPGFEPRPPLSECPRAGGGQTDLRVMPSPALQQVPWAALVPIGAPFCSSVK